jgi:hypothetical protein
MISTAMFCGAFGPCPPRLRTSSRWPTAERPGNAIAASLSSTISRGGAFGLASSSV